MGQGDSQLTNLVVKVKSFDGLSDKVNALEKVVYDPSNFKNVDVIVEDIVREIMSSPGLLTKVTDEIVTKHQQTIGQAVTKDITKNESFGKLLSQTLNNNDQFKESTTKTFVNDPQYQQQFKGEKGDPGSIETASTPTIRWNLFDDYDHIYKNSFARNRRTLWCDNGDNRCVLPEGKKGLDFRGLKVSNLGYLVGGSQMTSKGISVGGGGGVSFMDNEGTVFGSNQIGTHGWAAYMNNNDGGTVKADVFKIGDWEINGTQQKHCVDLGTFNNVYFGNVCVDADLLTFKLNGDNKCGMHVDDIIDYSINRLLKERYAIRWHQHKHYQQHAGPGTELYVCQQHDSWGG